MVLYLQIQTKYAELHLETKTCSRGIIKRSKGGKIQTKRSIYHDSGLNESIQARARCVLRYLFDTSGLLSESAKQANIT